MNVSHLFQSTLPARGATVVGVPCCCCVEFQSTLPARGATLKDNKIKDMSLISIHAPRTGSDGALKYVIEHKMISIHAPRTGSDKRRHRAGHCGTYFNPRSPHGERRCSVGWFLTQLIFQSTLPARGATVVGNDNYLFITDFNPRSPHGERPRLFALMHGRCHFNPRSPHGERPA